MRTLGERITATRVYIAGLRSIESRKPQMARKRRRLERKLVLLELAARWRRRIFKPSRAQVAHEVMNVMAAEEEAAFRARLDTFKAPQQTKDEE
ncbi:hypothetical protein [Streptomyces sp. CCM_MD2014]|uniref:hypothetical protein n=1 Tax=Streptomyces sp. CCM_MD2014 TaxID=1561022 RepID=UPI00052A4C3B|nr:hypothetical protein [Streptomyces sp. CCM_MD2014]AIV36419.1 hypothetical protein NI25_25520 [Streptomyces sp. CCM_MD2014]